MEINNRSIDASSPPFIIAEAGVNHNGDLETAKKMVDAAVEARADAVKFQTFKAENVVGQDTEKVEYQKQFTEKQESQFEMLKKLELSIEEHKELINYCNQREIIFLSTPYCFETANIIEELNLPLYKIGSTDTINLPLLQHIANKGKPIILSTGMCNLSEVEKAVDTILETGNDNLILLHCVSNYPAKFDNVNLRAMDTMKQAFNLPVGYSDHTLGIEAPIAAVARGAVVIEKHFTLDREMKGPDHQASLEPEQLKRMVTGIRNIEQALGNGRKQPTKSEEENMKAVRKSLVVKEMLNPGQILTKDVLEIKRPGTGISPEYFDLVVNMKVKKRLASAEVLQWEDLKNE